MVKHKKHIERKPYTKFYLTMLILSTVGTGLGLLGLFGLPQALSEFSLSPGYAIVSLISYLNLAAAIVALVLLWQQKVAGIWIKLSTYVASILLTIPFYITSGPVLQVAIDEAKQEMAKSSAKLTGNFIEVIVTASFTAALVVTVLTSIAFGLLWFFAWRHQSKSDD